LLKAKDDRLIAFVTSKRFKSPVAERIPLQTSLRLLDLENWQKTIVTKCDQASLPLLCLLDSNFSASLLKESRLIFLEYLSK
jgi:hypothetical protein